MLKHRIVQRYSCPPHAEEVAGPASTLPRCPYDLRGQGSQQPPGDDAACSNTVTNPPVVGLVHGGSVPSPSCTLRRDQVVPNEKHLPLRDDDFRSRFSRIGAVCKQ